MLKLFKRRAQGLLEYVLILAMVLGVFSFGASLVKDPILSLFSTINSTINAGGGATPTDNPIGVATPTPAPTSSASATPTDSPIVEATPTPAPTSGGFSLTDNFDRSNTAWHSGLGNTSDYQDAWDYGGGYIEDSQAALCGAVGDSCSESASLGFPGDETLPLTVNIDVVNIADHAGNATVEILLNDGWRADLSLDDRTGSDGTDATNVTLSLLDNSGNLINYETTTAGLYPLHVTLVITPTTISAMGISFSTDPYFTPVSASGIMLSGQSDSSARDPIYFDNLTITN